MKKITIFLLAIAGWFAVITQYVLMQQNSVISIGEASICFFSYYTILTNIAVAFYFSAALFNATIIRKTGLLSAITVYITMVSLVYQVALRHIWNPQGLQKLVDELLHTVIPIATLIYWSLHQKRRLHYQQILKWSIYPLAYLFFILLRGHFSDFYPYPFVDLTEIGIKQTLINASMILALFMVVSILLIFLNRRFMR